MSLPCHSPWFVHLNNTHYLLKYNFRSASLWSFHHPPAISSFLGPNTLLSTLFSDTV
jgi:hypothetical protein